MTIDFDVQDKIATITLNRPEALNAMTPHMYERLSECWVEVRDNPDIWVAVVTGAPPPNRTPEKQVFSSSKPSPPSPNLSSSGRPRPTRSSTAASRSGSPSSPRSTASASPAA